MNGWSDDQLAALGQAVERAIEESTGRIVQDVGIGVTEGTHTVFGFDTSAGSSKAYVVDSTELSITVTLGVLMDDDDSDVVIEEPLTPEEESFLGGMKGVLDARDE